MLKLILAAALLVTAVTGVAYARNCTTTCQTYGSQTTCQQTCW